MRPPWRVLSDRQLQVWQAIRNEFGSTNQMGNYNTGETHLSRNSDNCLSQSPLSVLPE